MRTLYQKIKIIFAALFFVSCVSLFARSVTVTDLGGNRYHGSIIADTKNSIKLKLLSNEIHELKKDDIKRIDYLKAKGESKPTALLDWFRSRQIFGVYAYGYGGLFSLDTNKLYRTINNAGFSAPTNEPEVSYGFGSTLELGEAIIGVEAASTLKRQASSSSGQKFNTTVSASYFIFRGGFSLFRTKYIHLFPYIGAGGGGIEFSLTPKDKTSFNSGLNGNAGRIVASNSSLIVLAAMEVNIRYPLMQWANADTGFITGIQAGYATQLEKNKWAASPTGYKAALANGPNAGFDGFFGRLMLGMYMTF